MKRPLHESVSERRPRGLPRGKRANQNGTCSLGIGDSSGLVSGSLRSIVFIGIGSNLDDPLAQCIRAIRCIGETGEIRVLRRSSFYRTEPLGVPEQPWFVNVVVEARTALQPRALLDRLKRIEEALGRVPGQKWGPRLIDLDLLLYDQKVMEDEGFTVPHPELHKRRFVLVPLYEIAPYVIHPAFGISIRGLLERVQDTSVVEKIEDPAECI